MAASARALRAQERRGTTYGDLAYDLDAMSREYALRHAGEDVRREAVPSPKVRSVTAPRARQRQRLSVVSVLGFLAVTALAVVTLSQYVQLTVISSEVVKLQSELSELQTENVSLTTKYEQTFDLSTIKEAAEAAGMSKPSSSQIYYIDMSGSDNAVVYQRQEAGVLSRVFTSLSHGIYAVVEYFD